MNPQDITLISFGYFDNNFLTKVVENVRHQYTCNVFLREGHFDLSDFYDAARRQYDANRILLEVEKNFSADTCKTIGLFNVDLFIPIFTYIFGQAYLGGRSGIASLFRLSNERYGIAADNDLLIERFSKEIIHELGHNYNLIHCHVPDCVMISGSYVEDIDQKTASFCASCRSKLMM